MKLSKIFVLIITVFIFTFLTAGAATIYLADVATGNGSGSDPSDRKAIQTYNNSAGANPGDTLSLGGTNATELYMPSSGLPGDPITIYFEPNAMLSQSNGILFACAKSYIVINGGSNGVVQNTATGTGLTYSNANDLFYLSGSSFVTVSNLNFLNEYVHTSPNDSNPDIAANGAVYANSWSGSNYVVNCTFSNVGWCISSENGSGGAFLEVSNCSFVNYDHGIVPNGFTNILIANCTFGSTSNWDTTVNAYHHDGIHYFDPTPYVNSYVICGNKFLGNWGNNNTAHIYTEQGPSNVMVFNNVFLQWPGNTLNDGFIVVQGNNDSFYNNTIVGQGVYNQNAVEIGGLNVTFVNNLVSDVDTFVSLTETNGCILSNNVYSADGPGGNNPWSAPPFSTSNLSAWQSAVGDVNSIYTIVNSDNIILPGNSAINQGANLSSIFTTDFTGAARPSSGSWTIGAISSAISSQPIITVTPANLNFGAMAIGTITNATFMVQNTGGGTLTGNASVSAPFSIVSGGSYSLTAGQSTNIMISYNPATTGTNVQTATFTGGGGATIMLNGTAAMPPPQNLVPHATGT